MGPARASATMWSAASPDDAVRGSRLDLPPLTVWSTSSIPRPDLPPHRRRCLQPAVAGHHDSLLQFFQRSFQGCNRGYVVAAEPSSDTSVVMPPGAFSCLSGPSPSVHASSCKQPQPPSVPRWWGFPVWAERRREGGRSRTTRCAISCYWAGRWRTWRVRRCLPVFSKHRTITGRNIASHIHRCRPTSPNYS